MKKISVSGNTLVIAISAIEVYTNTRNMTSRLRAIIPPNFKELLDDYLEVVVSGNHLVVKLSDYHKTKEVLAGLIANYLQEAVIVDECSAYDDAFLIRLLDDLKPRSIDRAVLKLLNEKVASHIAEAARNGRAPAHHRQSNVEKVGISLTEN